MPPQPLSKVKRDAAVIISPLGLRLYPCLGALAAEAIGTWSTVDAELAKLLGAMLDTAWRPANAMFAELSSSTAQTAAIRGVAKEQFKRRPREAEVFEAIMLAVASGWKRRNPLAHHLWAYSDDLEDALLLIDPRDDVRLEIARDEANRAAIRAWRSVRKRKRPPAPEFKEPRPPLDRVMVYREADFLELARDFSELADTIGEFGMFATPAFAEMRDHPSFAGLYDHLEARPLIAPTLRRLRERQRNGPKAPPRPPDAGDQSDEG